MNLQEENINKAFSSQAPVFDEQNETNTIVLWVRDKVRKEVLSHLQPGNTILELNCGTGLDSIFFAQEGYSVMATDIAEGMLGILSKKRDVWSLQNKIRIQNMSFNDFSPLNGEQFDYVFSNFGGLNCTDRLDVVLSNISSSLKKGAYCTLVVMPIICPWEIISAFKGNFHLAFRRLKKNGSKAHIDGNYFTCYYYTPNYIRRNLPGFELCSLKGLCITVPPPYNEKFIDRHQGFAKTLKRIENKICNNYLFNRWCDHFMITLRKK